MDFPWNSGDTCQLGAQIAEDDFDWLLVSEPGFLALAGTFETFQYEVEDWEELGPNTETSK